MDILKLVSIGIIFCLGFLGANLLNYYSLYGLENPLSNGFGFSDGLNEAPFDFVDESDIEIYDDKVVIYVDDVSLSNYAPTGSMRPVLDDGANGLRVVPFSVDDVHVGDIISFEKDGKLIVHRVIEKDFDGEGIYFITKGDNNSLNDGKVRFKDVKYLTIGVIW